MCVLVLRSFGLCVCVLADRCYISCTFLRFCRQVLYFLYFPEVGRFGDFLLLGAHANEPHLRVVTLKHTTLTTVLLTPLS
jgi:hypothetical protein